MVCIDYMPGLQGGGSCVHVCVQRVGHETNIVAGNVPDCIYPSHVYYVSASTQPGVVQG